MTHVDHANGVLAFRRDDPDGNAMLVVVNVSETSWPDGGYLVPTTDNNSVWRIVLDSQSALFGGDGLRHADFCLASDKALRLSVPRWSVTLYRRG